MLMDYLPGIFSFFFFNDTATTEIYTLSLHDALPIYAVDTSCATLRPDSSTLALSAAISASDRKSTRLNSSHGYISYAVFCLKKKNQPQPNKQPLSCLLFALARRSHVLALHPQLPATP